MKKITAEMNRDTADGRMAAGVFSAAAISRIRGIIINPADPACHAIVAALAVALLDACFDIYGALQDGGPDLAIRASVRALYDALLSDYLETPSEARGAIRQAAAWIGASPPPASDTG